MSTQQTTFPTIDQYVKLSSKKTRKKAKNMCGFPHCGYSGTLQQLKEHMRDKHPPLNKDGTPLEVRSQSFPVGYPQVILSCGCCNSKKYVQLSNYSDSIIKKLNQTQCCCPNPAYAILQDVSDAEKEDHKKPRTKREKKESEKK